MSDRIPLEVPLWPPFLYNFQRQLAAMADLSRVESMQYPSGHLAHLTENQQAQLNAFEKLAQEQGYYTPATDTAEASHDDETMLYARFWAR